MCIFRLYKCPCVCNMCGVVCVCVCLRVRKKARVTLKDCFFKCDTNRGTVQKLSEVLTERNGLIIATICYKLNQNSVLMTHKILQNYPIMLIKY